MNYILHIAFQSFWNFVGITLLLSMVIKAMAIIIQRFFRMIMILSKGWPPDHLDADGDWKPEPKKKKNHD